MTALSAKQRDKLMERHNLVLNTAEGMKQPFTCSDVVGKLGIPSGNVAASLRYLQNARAVKIVDKYTDRGKGYISLWAVTGAAIDRDAIKKLHRPEEAHEQEPAGRVIEKIVKPGHRIIRFGRDHKAGKGQSASGVSCGFSSLVMIG